ncbi:MAG TPA: hypothetical protein VHT52_17850 [Stellaceae bacterium]|jgi:hypothetical protein|nr:hypothetical protein [Stellaceae bacterium]
MADEFDPQEWLRQRGSAPAAAPAAPAVAPAEGEFDPQAWLRQRRAAPAAASQTTPASDGQYAEERELGSSRGGLFPHPELSHPLTSAARAGYGALRGIGSMATGLGQIVSHVDRSGVVSKIGATRPAQAFAQWTEKPSESMAEGIGTVLPYFAPVGGATRALNPIARGVAAGTTAAAVQPVQDAKSNRDFWWRKLEQTGTGAALGGGLSTLAEITTPPIQRANRAMYQYVMAPLGLRAPQSTGRAALQEMRDTVGGRINDILRRSSVDQPAITGFHGDLNAILARADSDLSGDTQRALNRILRDDVMSATGGNLNDIRSGAYGGSGGMAGGRLQTVFGQLATESRRLRKAAVTSGDDQQRQLADTLDRVRDRLMARATIPGGPAPLQAARTAYARWAEIERHADEVTGLATPRNLLKERRQGPNYWEGDPQNEMLREEQTRMDRAAARSPLNKIARHVVVHGVAAPVAHALGLPWWTGPLGTLGVEAGLAAGRAGGQAIGAAGQRLPDTALPAVAGAAAAQRE